MANQDRIRRMADKKQWDRLREQFRGTQEERMIAANVCVLSESKDAFNLLVSEINGCTDENEKIRLIKTLGSTNRGEAAVYLSWLASTVDSESIRAAIEETQTMLRTRFR